MTGKEQAQNLLLKSLIFGDELDLGSADDFDEQPDPFARKMHDGAIRAAMGKATDTTCVIDLPLPPADGVDADEPFLKAPRIVRGVPSALKKSSGTKFVELLALVRKVFAGHDEEMSEVFAICEQARSDARAEAIAMAAQ